MAQQLTGWIDYDRPLLPGLQPSQRIDYFERRVRQVAINPLGRLLLNEIHVSPDSSALLIFGVSLCCTIEATGKFLTGGQVGNAQRFHAFLNRYMSPDFQSQRAGSLTYGEALWSHFRNGLAHGFAVCHGGFEGNRGGGYFTVKQIAGQDSLMVNPSLLYDDFARGFGRYTTDLRSDQPGGQLFAAFGRVFDEVFVQGR